MSQIMKFGNPEATMSSLELLDIINSARKEQGEPAIANRHFIARIEDELDGELGDRKTFTHPQNHKQIACYDLNRDQCTLVGMRESKGVRRKVLEKLKELNDQQAFQIPQTKAEALRLAADLAEQVEQQQALIEHQKPAVEFVGRYVESTSGSMSFRQAAKALGVKENVFRAFLARNRIMYPQGSSWLPYANHIDAGRFEVKTGSNNGHAFTQSLFTAKGFRWLADLLADGVAV